MKQSIVHVALVVRDYDEAIAFFTETTRFTLVEDRWIPEQSIAPEETSCDRGA